MSYIIKKHIVKIPAEISAYYCTTSNIITFTNFFIQKTLQLKTQLIFDKSKKLLKVTREGLWNSSNYERKKLKSIQTTQVVLLKQMLLDILLLNCNKLKLIGVGFKVSILKLFDFDILHFKLGYSHGIYLKIPSTLKVFCLKYNKLFLLGNSYLFVTQLAALIRSYKTPEPYKGKGILYISEKLVLKEGKKI